MLLSPFKQVLAQKNGHLPAIKKAEHEILAAGSQSIVLTHGPDKVLVVTRTLVAKNIELLEDLPVDETLFSRPKIVGINIDIPKLLDPLHPDKVKKLANKAYTIVNQHIWQSNVVYELPRYDGTLEDLPEINFEKCDIDALEKTLTQSLELLHQHQLSHNDLSLKNIFYNRGKTGLKFFLGDFGSLGKNNPEKHHEKSQKDFVRLKRVIAKAKEILAQKEKNALKIQTALPFLVSYSRRQHARMNKELKELTIPIQEVAMSERKHRTSRARKLF